MLHLFFRKKDRYRNKETASQENNFDEFLTNGALAFVER